MIVFATPLNQTILYFLYICFHSLDILLVSGKNSTSSFQLVTPSISTRTTQTTTTNTVTNIKTKSVNIKSVTSSKYTELLVSTIFEPIFNTGKVKFTINCTLGYNISLGYNLTTPVDGKYNETAYNISFHDKCFIREKGKTNTWEAAVGGFL